MTVAWLMLFGGFVLIVAGWKDKAVLEVARGNFDVPKAAKGSLIPNNPGGGK